jgi:hypothetical protein
VFWKEILKLWSNTEGRPDRLLKRPDKCKLEQFKASQNRGSSGRESTSSGRLVLWTAERPDDWQGTEFSDLQTVQNLLEAFLNSGIPVKKHYYIEVILSNRMWPITN